MSHYTTNVGAKLYMGTATTDPLPAPGADTFTQVTQLQIVTPAVNEMTTAEYNILDSAEPISLGGKLQPKKVTGTIVFDWALAIHQLLEADSVYAGGRKRNWYILYPDTGARRDDFVGFVSKLEKTEFSAESDPQPHKGNFEISQTGATTVTY